MITEKLKETGFDGIGTILTENIPFEPSLIELCKMNTCGAYGKNYTCPPFVGETEDLIKKAKSYKKAIVFQKVYKLEDSFDFEGMVEGKNNFKKLTNNVYDLCKDNLPEFLILGAGGCDLCNPCGAVENVPCRFPDRAIASLESYSIQVSTLAERCGLKYINGQNTVTYFGAIFCN